jgi:hypothetical protein
MTAEPSADAVGVNPRSHQGPPDSPKHRLYHLIAAGVVVVVVVAAAVTLGVVLSKKDSAPVVEETAAPSPAAAVSSLESTPREPTPNPTTVQPTISGSEPATMIPSDPPSLYPSLVPTTIQPTARPTPTLSPTADATTRESATPSGQFSVLIPSFVPDNLVWYNATVDYTVLGVEITCTEVNATCWIVGSFNSVLLVGEANDDDTQWWATDPEFDYMRLGGCRDPLCAVLCDNICSCKARASEIHEESRV